MIKLTAVEFKRTDAMLNLSWTIQDTRTSWRFRQTGLASRSWAEQVSVLSYLSSFAFRNSLYPSV